MTQVIPSAIALFTDFGVGNLYLGQIKLRLAAARLPQPVVELACDAPAFNPKAAGYLLSALARQLPTGTITVAVVDPGVGSERRAVVVQADGCWYVGPDNGLLAGVGRYPGAQAWRIDWRPEMLSDSFHGRDLFAPVAARICAGQPVPETPLPVQDLAGAGWPDDLCEVVYLDAYGNAFTGIRAVSLQPGDQLRVASRQIAHARVFSEVPVGELFWYHNSCGLVEIAANQASAAALLRLRVGSEVAVI